MKNSHTYAFSISYSEDREDGATYLHNTKEAAISELASNFSYFCSDENMELEDYDIDYAYLHESGMYAKIKMTSKHDKEYHKTITMMVNAIYA